MNILNIVCIVLAVFGALSWMTLGIFQADLITITLGSARTIGSDMLRIIVSLASLFLLVTTFLKKSN